MATTRPPMIYYHVLEGLLAILPVALVWSWGWLRLGHDAFFFIYYAQVVVYVYVAPALWLPHVPPSLQTIYVRLGGYALVLFAYPLLGVYLRLRRPPPDSERATLSIRPARVLMLAGGMAVLGLLFLGVASSYGMFFTRIGSEGYAALLAHLPLGSFLEFRLFSLAAPGAVLVLTASIALMPAQARWRRALIATTLVVASAFCLQRGVNSRSDIVLLVLLLSGVVLTVSPHARINARQMTLLVVLLLLGGYGYQVVENARWAMASTGSITGDVLNPLLEMAPEADASPLNQMALRLNGLDLMARMTPSAELQGFAHGRAWAIPAEVILNEITLQRDANFQYHITGMDTPKRFLMVSYTTLRLNDYASCLLTDTYGNFGPAGMLLSALIMAGILGASARILAARSEPIAMLSVLLLLPTAMAFEQSTWYVLFQWLRVVPVLLAFLMLAPWLKSPRPGRQAARAVAPGLGGQRPQVAE